MEEQSKQDWEHTFGLFKLEYEQTAERYENIYKAIWQIFSYMGILAAGILTFGSRSSSLPIEAIVFIALTPLVFWFLAIYVPMNQYGENAREHLKKIEEEFNKTHKSWQLTHYASFRKSKPSWRVVNAVCFFGGTISIVWIILGVILLTIFLFRIIPYSIDLLQLQKSTSEKIEIKLEPLEVTMQEPQLRELQNKLDSLIRDLKANSTQP
jgi:hypothetical protein